jgi:hypothetical protein
MLSYLFVRGQQYGAWRHAGAGDVTHRRATPDCVGYKARYLCVGLTQIGQYPKNNQHDFPAALPLRRRPDSVLAAF